MTTYPTSVITLNPSDLPGSRHVFPPSPFNDPSRLAPEDAWSAHSPPRRQRDAETYTRPINGTADAEALNSLSRKRRDKDRGRSGSRRGKGVWKKLLWVKHPKCIHIPNKPNWIGHLLSTGRS